MRMEWTLIPGTPNYECAGWRAVYWRTVRGFGAYKIYRPDGALWGQGGLPAHV